MKRTVYIETSVAAYYYETREGVKIQAWRETTRQWWKRYSHLYQLVTSDAVLVELEAGDHPQKKRKLALLDNVERLAVLPIIDDIVSSYIENKVVPDDAGGDAYHLAMASFYDIDFLLTWNCKHLANPNKFKHIHVINTRLELSTPILCTPEQLVTHYQEQ
jgi:predicted nucleic acid-binding protein